MTSEHQDKFIAGRWNCSNAGLIAEPSFESIGEPYECRALICPEEEGGFSVFAMRLPGVVSQGETVQEALENIADAFRAAIQSYETSGMNIPWRDVSVECVPGSVERWIVVNV